MASTTYTPEQLDEAYALGVRNATLRNPLQEWLADWANVNDGAVAVSYNSALTYSSVYGAVSQIAGDIAGLPFHVHRVNDDGDKEIARNHPAEYLLNDTPNELMDALTLRETMQSHALLYGNGYCAIEFDGAERPARLIPLLPDRTLPKVDENGRLFYENRSEDGEVVQIAARDVIHIKALGWNGLAGHSVFSLARNSWSLGMAAEKHGTTSFKNGARPSLVLETESRLTEDEAETLLSRWEARHGGSENQNRPAVLSSGLKVHPFSMSNEDAQWLESRKFQRIEVAAWFAMPPHKLGDDSRLSYNSIEAENRAYLNQTLRRWLKKWESECGRKLLADRQRRNGSLIMRHDTEDLISADIETQVDVLVKLRSAEIVNRNEARRKLGWTGTGPEGDEYRNPNTSSGPSDKPPPEEPPAAETSEAAAAVRAAVIERLTSLIKSEIARATNAAQRAKDFVGWCDGFYETHTELMVTAMTPLFAICSTIPGMSCGITVDEMSAQHAERSKDDLLAAAGVAMDRDELRVHVSEAVAQWPSRAEELAKQICEVTYVQDR